MKSSYYLKIEENLLFVLKKILLEFKTLTIYRSNGSFTSINSLKEIKAKHLSDIKIISVSNVTMWVEDSMLILFEPSDLEEYIPIIVKICALFSTKIQIRNFVRDIVEYFLEYNFFNCRENKLNLLEILNIKNVTLEQVINEIELDRSYFIKKLDSLKNSCATPITYNTDSYIIHKITFPIPYYSLNSEQQQIFFSVCDKREHSLLVCVRFKTRNKEIFLVNDPMVYLKSDINCENPLFELSPYQSNLSWFQTLNVNSYVEQKEYAM